jgi:hypothetical protein
MNKQFVIMTTVGLVIGVSEALIYYNMGKSKEQGRFSYSMPPAPEMMKTVGIVIVTSLLTAMITTGVEKMVGVKEMQESMVIA